MKFASPEALVKFIRDHERAAEPQRFDLARQIGVDLCMYEGIHWIASQSSMNSGAVQQALTKYLNDYNPDSNRLRVTSNEITRLIQKTASATYPNAIEVEARPPARDLSPATLFRAQVAETVVNAAVRKSRYVSERRDANFRRSICGVYGVGLHIDRFKTAVDLGNGPVEMDDARLSCFTFEPSRLIVDPAVNARNLSEHEWFIYRDVWTLAKIERVLGIKLDADKAKDIGQLASVEQDFNRLSNGRLFSKYRYYSREKGALVYQIHVKTSPERFGKMYVGVHSDGELRIVNFDNADSPYGGDGNPFVLLHGHRRGDSMWSMSDVAMLKGHQDMLNLVQTFFFRQLQRNAGFQWMVDRRSLDANQGEEQFQNQFTNTVGGVVFWRGGQRDENVQPPQLANFPPPSPTIDQKGYELRDRMREQVHRSEGNFGVLKSHVPDASYARAIDESDQVLGVRIQEDIEADSRFASMLLGTVVNLARQGAPCILASLREEGLDEMELAELASLDPERHGVDLYVREASVRFRGHNARRQALVESLQMQSLSPSQFRSAMARDLDSPVTEDDGYYATEAERAAMSILSGQEWVPISLGEYNDVFLSAFRRAALSKAARSDPETAFRVAQAIELQTQMAVQELQIVGQAANPQPVVDTPNQVGTLSEDADVGELMRALSGPVQPRVA